MGLLKDLFKHAAELTNDSDDEECGTVCPYPLFSASDDASLLNRAVTTEGVEQIHIVEPLLKRSNEQRQQIKAAYQESFGKSLEEDLKSVLKGDMEELALALLMSPAHYDAYLLRHAMKGFGTTESVLIEVLVSRSNEEIKKIKEVYKEVYERDLAEDIDDENRGHFQDALMNLLKGTRSEETNANSDLCGSDAQALYHAGEKRMGTNDTVFVHIFTSRSNAELREIFKKYRKHSDEEIEDALDFEMSGDIEDCLVAIAKCAMNKPAFFAERLHDAIAGYGTRTEILIRVLVSRAEKDLKRVEKEYKKMYQKSLQEDIMAESEGDLESALIKLCGEADD